MSKIGQLALEIEEAKSLIGEREIITIYDPPPIPYRGDDWTAVLDGYEPGDPLGHGPTRDTAIADLIAQETV